MGQKAKAESPKSSPKLPSSLPKSGSSPKLPGTLPKSGSKTKSQFKPNAGGVGVAPFDPKMVKLKSSSKKGSKKKKTNDSGGDSGGMSELQKRLAKKREWEDKS